MRQGSGLVLATLIQTASPMAGLPDAQKAAETREQAWSRSEPKGWRDRGRRCGDAN